MSTIATARATLTQHALSSPPSPQQSPAVDSINSSATASLTTTPLSALVTHSNTCPPILVEKLCALRRFQSDMHPDCLLLQAHGVTSPRLSPSVSALAGEKQRRHSETLSMEVERVEAEEVERCEEIDSVDEMDVVGDQDEELDMARASQTKEHIISSSGCVDEDDAEVEMEEDEDDEAVSLCSEDSELSVGQEEGGTALTTKSRQITNNFCDFSQQRRLLLSNVGNMMALCAPSAFNSVQAAACADGSDARSSASTDDNTTQTAADDESIGSSIGMTIQQAALPPPPPSAVIDPYNVMASALRMPVPVLPRVATQTMPSPFQTELMRKSHLYAEELMKQQMQFMAAARASAFTLRGANAVDSAAAAVERRAFARVPSASQQQMPNLAAGLHSQLTAITKMSQLSAAAAAAAVAVAAVANNNQPAQNAHQQHKTNLPNNNEALTQFGALTSAPSHLLSNNASTGAISSLSQLQAQMKAHFPYAHSNNVHNNNNNNLNHNNNLNEPALKFSIDNILKADFGRRLAENAACLAAYNNGTRAGKMCSGGTNNINSATHRARKTLASLSSMNASSASVGTIKSPIAIDLTHLGPTSTASTTATSSATLSFSHTLANICTNSSDSNSTAVSSSYGGGASENAKSPAGASASNGDFGAFSSSKCASSAATELSAKAAADETNGGSGSKSSGTGASGSGPIVWPAWVYCTRYSDRPSSGPRTRKPKKLAGEKGSSSTASNGSGSGSSSAATAEDKRPRTAFSGSQLARLKHEFTESRYLTEKRRQQLSSELGLNEAQIKIWFQNKRAKLKKSSGTKNPLALQLMAQGLYNHSTVPLTREEEELQELQERENAAAEAARNGSTATATTIST